MVFFEDPREVVGGLHDPRSDLRRRAEEKHFPETPLAPHTLRRCLSRGLHVGDYSQRLERSGHI